MIKAVGYDIQSDFRLPFILRMTMLFLLVDSDAGNTGWAGLSSVVGDVLPMRAVRVTKVVRWVAALFSCVTTAIVAVIVVNVRLRAALSLVYLLK